MRSLPIPRMELSGFKICLVAHTQEKRGLRNRYLRVNEEKRTTTVERALLN
jgi:hypothetical protein